MASDRISTLVVELKAQTTQLEAGLKRVQKSTRRTETRFAKLGKSMKLLQSGLAGLGVGLGATALFSMARGAAELGSALDNTSRAVGFTTDAIQALRFAGEEIGLGSGNVDLGLQRFSRRVGEAQNGTGELVKQLELLGVELRNQSGNFKPIEQVFNEYAAAIAQSENKQQALAGSFKALDSEAAKLLVSVVELDGGLDAWTTAAKDAGRVLDEETIEALADADRLFRDMTVSIKLNTAAFAGWAIELGKLVVTKPQKSVAELATEIDRIQKIIDRKAPSEGTFFGESVENMDKLRDRVSALREEIRLLNESRFADPSTVLGMFPETVRETVAAVQEFDLALQDYSEDITAVSTALEGIEGLGVGAEAPFAEITSSVIEADSAMAQFGDTVTNDVAGTLSSLATGGKVTFRDFANAIIRDVIRMTVTMTTLKAVMSGISGLFGGAPTTAQALGEFAPAGFLNAKGNAFQGGNVIPFAKGGIVSQPQIFPMANGAVGLRGEAGPEAVIPLVRRGGVLGVRGGGGGSTFAPSITVNMNAGSDGDGAAIGREVARAVKGAWNAMATDQKRVGGVLNPVR